MANDDGGNFMTGFVLGGIIGAVVGILLAPKPGLETRADLLEQSDILRSRAEELAARARDRFGPTVEGMRERVGPVAGRVASRVAGTSTKPSVDGVPEAVDPEPIIDETEGRA